MSLNAFRLSRLYAEGWNVANKLTSDESSDFDAQKMEEMTASVKETGVIQPVEEIGKIAAEAGVVFTPGAGAGLSSPF